MSGARRQADQALAVPAEPCSTVSAASGFDPSRVAEIAALIESASVPHEGGALGKMLGNLGERWGSRSLGYYMGVGIDHFGHDYSRHQELLNRAAVAVLTALATEAGTAETLKDGSVHEGAGLEEATPNPPNTSSTQSDGRGL